MVRILWRCSLRGAGLRAKYRPYRRCEGLKARQGPFLARDSRPYFTVQDTLIVLPSQQFSIRHNKTPLFSYSLWYLTALYSESFVLAQSSHAREADVLRSYGAEIARALMNDVMAPGYLRAMRYFGQKTLTRRDPTPFPDLSPTLL